MFRSPLITQRDVHVRSSLRPNISRFSVTDKTYMYNYKWHMINSSAFDLYSCIISVLDGGNSGICLWVIHQHIGDTSAHWQYPSRLLSSCRSRGKWSSDVFVTHEVYPIVRQYDILSLQLYSKHSALRHFPFASVNTTDQHTKQTLWCYVTATEGRLLKRGICIRLDAAKVLEVWENNQQLWTIFENRLQRLYKYYNMCLSSCLYGIL